MGVSTDGQIFYGAVFSEGTEFPWGEESIEDWWTFTVGKFEHSFKLYDERGNYIDGVRPTPERLREYFGERSAFDKANPLPVELVNYCAGECPMYALAVPGTRLVAGRGNPTDFMPEALLVDAAAAERFVCFCKEHDIPLKPLRWWLASYWG